MMYEMRRRKHEPTLLLTDVCRKVGEWICMLVGKVLDVHMCGVCVFTGEVLAGCVVCGCAWMDVLVVCVGVYTHGKILAWWVGKIKVA